MAKKDTTKIGDPDIDNLMNVFEKLNIFESLDSQFGTDEIDKIEDIKDKHMTTYKGYQSLPDENKEEVVEFYMQNALNTDPNIHLKDTVPGWKEDMMNIHLDDLSTSAAKRYFTYKNVRSLQLYKREILDEMDPDILLGFKNHVYNYNNSLIADNYKNKDYYTTHPEIMSYMGSHTEPARYVGFLEDNPELYRDIILASHETGVDPNALYMMYMQEGGAVQEKVQEYWGDLTGMDKSPLVDPNPSLPRYKSDFFINSFSDIGLDALLDERDNIMNRGYLDEDNPVVTSRELRGKQDYPMTNEAGMKSMVGDIKMSDAVRGIGALMRLQEDYLRDHFNAGGVDFDTMDSRQKTFWTYASINAGHVDTKRLFDAYGANPWENDQFHEDIDRYNEDGSRRAESKKLADWMDNVLRVLGGYDLMTEFDAFNLEKGSLR